MRPIGQRNHELPESKHPSSGIVCPSQTCPTGETCDNQTKPGLENKVGSSETHTPTPGCFAGCQLRHGVELHHAIEFFAMPIAIKCREGVCGATESSALSCRTVDVGRCCSSRLSNPELVLNHDSHVALLHHVLKCFQWPDWHLYNVLPLHVVGVVRGASLLYRSERTVEVAYISCGQ